MRIFSHSMKSLISWWLGRPRPTRWRRRPRLQLSERGRSVHLQTRGRVCHPMAHLLFLLVVILANFAHAELTPMLPPEVAKGYTLTWQDEFTGDTLNKAEWNLRTGERFASMNKAENVSVTDGMLRIALKKEPAGKLDYTSGGVISKREFKYGYYESSFRSPKGEGWHVSFWMMKNVGKTEGNRQEIDVCEHDTKDQTSYGTNLHIHAPEHKGLAGRRVKTPDLSKGFHTLGCEFTPKEIRQYFNGKLVGVWDATSFKHDPMSIWLTTVGWANLPWSNKEKIDDSMLPAFADFDYVRFFERQGEEPTRPRTIIAYGDSLTEGGSGGEQAWVKRVERESGGKLKVINEGKGGRATTDGKADFDKMTARQPRADIIVIALGTNDSRDLKPNAIHNAKSNVTHMINRARQCYGPSVKLLLVGPPNINKAALVATKPIANEREAQLKALGTAFDALAKEKQCDFVNLFGIVPEETMIKDGVHPDATGHAAMAKVLLGRLLP
jgi:acyl-CoA thioesterase-1